MWFLCPSFHYITQFFCCNACHLRLEIQPYGALSCRKQRHFSAKDAPSLCCFFRLRDGPYHVMSIQCRYSLRPQTAIIYFQLCINLLWLNRIIVNTNAWEFVFELCGWMKNCILDDSCVKQISMTCIFPCWIVVSRQNTNRYRSELCAKIFVKKNCWRIKELPFSDSYLEVNIDYRNIRPVK